MWFNKFPYDGILPRYLESVTECSLLVLSGWLCCQHDYVNNQPSMQLFWWVWNFHNEEYDLLGCNAMHLGEIPMFRRTLSPPSSDLKIWTTTIRRGVQIQFLGPRSNTDRKRAEVCWILKSEDGYDMLLRNVGINQKYTALLEEPPLCRPTSFILIS
jgi:hypothetical protein